MPIRVHCPVCGYRIKAPDGSYGRRGQCPKCKLMIRLPSEAELTARNAAGAAASPTGESEPSTAEETGSYSPLKGAEGTSDSALDFGPPGE